MVDKNSANFLPKVFQTKTNNKFLNATVDQLIQEPNLSRLYGFIGRQDLSPAYEATDAYVTESDSYSQFYQLEPGLVINKRVFNTNNFAIDNAYNYVDLLNGITLAGGITTDHSRLFANEYYNYEGFVDLDKLINYGKYYWLPNGPTTLEINSGSIPLVETYRISRPLATDPTSEAMINQNVGNTGFSIDKFPGLTNPTITLVRGGSYTFSIGQPGHPFYIQTQPGLKGVSTYQSNINTRDVMGVINNGTTSGQIIFNVPNKNAQSFYETMPVFSNVDLITDIPYSAIQGADYVEFFKTYNIDSLTSFTSKKIILTNKQDDQWADVPANQRTGIWQIVNRDGIIYLTYLSDWPANTKVFVNEGQTYGHIFIFKNTKMEINLLPTLTASNDVFYYQDSTDVNLYGEIRIIDQDPEAVINLNDIIGKKVYISPNNVKFTNGLKIKFTSTTEPSNYFNNEYIIEGVGKNIQLVPYANLITPDPNNPNAGAGFDDENEPYDNTNYDLTLNAPLRKDYIVINRASIDGNAWSRTNRWFHEDVIRYSATFLNKNAPVVLDNNFRAIRPIVEYDANLKLFNHGVKYIQAVTVVDSKVTDIFNEVEGHSPYVLIDSAGKYYSDNVALEDGTFVVFTNERYENTKNKIYRVQNINPYDATTVVNRTTSTFTPYKNKVITLGSINNLKVNMSVTGTGISANTVIMSIDTLRGKVTLNNSVTENLATGTTLVFKSNITQVHLIPVHTMSEGESVVAISGATKQNDTYYWSNSSWKIAQQKFSLNQNPNFDVFDYAGNSFSDQDYYPSSTFAGSSLFGYSTSNSGIRDSELGFALSYRSIGNIGDIVFQNFYDTDTFHFSFNNSDYELAINNGYVHEIVPSDLSFNLRNNWVRIADLSKQLIERKFVATQYKNNFFPLNIVYTNSFNEKNIFVYVNGKELIRNVDYSLMGNSQGCQVNLTNDLKDRDILIIRIAGKSNSNKENYTLPKNLAYNSENTTFDSLTLGQIRNHLNEITSNSLDYTLLDTGNNNLRDINYKVVPGKILQHSAGVHLTQLMFNNDTTNIIKAIDFSRRSYTRFKDRFFYLLSSMNFEDVTDARTNLDLIMDEITFNSNSDQPFFYTDMIPAGSNKFISNTYPVYDTNYRNFNLINNYDVNDPGYYAVLVYLNGKQIINGIDYYNSGSIITLSNTLSLNINDTVAVYEYTNTQGCMIPATPTKLGLYPKFTPEIFVDNTYIQQDLRVIRGHDGSKTIAFNDYRDDIILEFEKRVYNNISVEYVNDSNSFSKLEPGAFRVTDYSIEEWTQLLSVSFLNWAGNNNINVFLNNTTASNDPFSFNYSQGKDLLFNNTVPGFWRGIYKYFYDTDSPHLAPWEMLGFSQMPSWWVARYGPAPYTSGNLVLWNELEMGLVYQHGYDSYIDIKYARPGLTSIIPVDEHGELLPPITSVITDYNQQSASGEWRFGDQSPQETAWRRSSDYPFAVQIAWALARPAQYSSLSLNRRDLIKIELLDQIINKQTGNRKLNLLVTDETQFVPGSNIWLRDRLSDIGLDITVNFIEIFEKYKLNLLYKASGYTDKNYLQIIADQASPTSTNRGVVLPQENYHIKLTKSSPIALATYSAVVIQKSANGFKVYGFDSNRPYFTIVPRRYDNDSYIVTVSESSAVIYNNDQNNIQVIPYGTQFNTVQQVVDFLISYGKFLTNQGFQFIDTTTDDTIEIQTDWTLSVKEFLYWLEQGWDNGTVLSVTPAGTSISFNGGYGIVDSLTNSFNGSRIIDSSGNTLQSTDYSTFRKGTSFNVGLKDKSKGIHLLDMYVVLYEHTLIFDNITVFNDIIYEPSLGNRQYRMKVTGFKTRDWDGSLYAPGFLINHNNVDQWLPVTDYFKGDIVLHKNLYYTAKNFIPGATMFNYSDWYEINGDLLSKQLIPNMAFNAQQFEHFYDVDTLDVNTNADMLARNSTGFVPRSYMNNMGVDTITQHKFYLGMIREKGTQAAVNAFLRAKLPYLNNNIQVDEQWAVRLANYGGTTQKYDVELSLANVVTTNGAYVIELVDTYGTKSGEWNSFTPKDLLIKPTNYNPEIFKANEVNPQVVSTAGPVLIDEVVTTVFDIIKINNISGLAPAMGEGSRIWVGADKNGSWNVYRLSAIGTKTKIVNVTYSNLDNTDKNNPKLQFTTDIEHNLTTNDLVMIKYGVVGKTNINVSGFYRVVATGDKVFAVILPLNAPRGSGSMKAQLFKLQPVRYPSKSIFAVSNPGKGWAFGDMAWVDGENSYSVMTNNDNWALNENLTPNFLTSSDNFGYSIDIKSNQAIMVSGAPGKNTKGSLYVYRQNDDTTWSVINNIQPDDSYASQFGYSVKYNDLDYAVVGAPGGNLAYVTDTVADLITVKQAIYMDGISTSAQFGYDVAASRDGNWIAVGAPGINEVYIFQLQKVETSTMLFVGLNEQLIPFPAQGQGLTANDIVIRKNGFLLVPYKDYTVGNVVIASTPTDDVWTLLSAPEATDIIEVTYQSWYRYVTNFTSTSASGSFGSTISFSADGSQLVVGAPNESRLVNGTNYPNMGAVYIYQRSIEKFVANGISNSFVLDNSPLYPKVTLNDVKEVYAVPVKNEIASDLLTNIYDVTGIAVGMIISGINIYSGTKVVSIEQQKDFTFNITMSHVSFDVVTVVDFKIDYTVVGTTLTLNNQIPSKDSILVVETNNFNLLETKTAIVAQNDLLFGKKVVICPKTCSIYVGATGYNSPANVGSGAVYRYVNSARLYGSITGTITNPLLNIGDSIRINGFKVTFTGYSSVSAALDINNATIPGISAKVLNNNRNLQINSDSNIAYNKIVISNTTSNAKNYLGLNVFDLYQIIYPNLAEDETNVNFGNQISVDSDSTRLVIGANLIKGVNYLKIVDGQGTTTFDGNSTKFTNNITQSGAAFLYEYQFDENETSITHGNFAYSKTFTSPTAMSNELYSTGVALSTNWLLITSLNNRDAVGVIYSHYNSSGKNNWTVTRTQPTSIDVRNIERIYIYNDNTKTLTAELPVIDPEHGLPVRQAAEQIRYIVNYDPAIYTNTPNTYSFASDSRQAWGSEHVGELWWDTNALKYVDWYQGNLISRLNNWGLTFPNSFIVVYEWIESDVAPNQYAKTHIKSGPAYVVSEVYSTKTFIDSITLKATTKYYFWVKNSEINSSLQKRDTALALQNLIANPRNSNEPFAVVLGTNSLALFNCLEIVNNDSKLHISLTQDRYANPVHQEWSMFDDGTDLGIAQEFLDRLNDSFAGQDSQGKIVPDPSLTEKEKYGLSIRPRQTTFADNFVARKIWVDNVNEIFSKYPIALLRDLNTINYYEELPVVDGTTIKVQVDSDNELLYYNPAFFRNGDRALVLNDSETGGWTIRHLMPDPANSLNQTWQILQVQNYDTRKYWTYADWYAPQYSENTQIVKTLNYEYELANSIFTEGDVVKIKFGTNGLWKLIVINKNSLELVGQQNATIKLSKALYENSLAGFGIDAQSFETMSFSADANIEFRKLFESINADILNVELRNEFKKLLGLVISTIATQFTQTDWLLKTSFINITHNVRSLDEIPVYINVQNLENIVTDFINEVKPYHTKIKQYLSTYDKLDISAMDTTDFDLPGYFNQTVQKYRSPQLGNVIDSDIFDKNVYQPWLDNHTYSIDRIDISNGGFGYDNTSKVEVVIDGDGTGATATAYIRSGEIIDIAVNNPGEGYTYAIVTIISDKGKNAKASAILGSTKARTFKTGIKFDRFTYSPFTKDWTPNTTYSAGDLIIYDYNVYRPALSSIGSQETITAQYVSGNKFSPIGLIELKVKIWEPFKKYSKDEIIVYKNKPYVSATDFVSDKYFNYNTNIYITHSVNWEPNTFYKIDTIFNHNDNAYRAIADFTSGEYFSAAGLINIFPICNYLGGYFDDAASRVWGYYNPISGMPGRDLTQLMTGLEYPGVNIIGATFDNVMGFGFGAYDQIAYDQRTYDENGLLNIYGSSALDTTYYSFYNDSKLGLRAEDILSDGAGYLDTNNSHAPEEFIPGYMFDALDIRVKTLNNTKVYKGPNIVVVASYADNFTTTFSFNSIITDTPMPNGGIEYISVFSDFLGPLVENIDYTINWENEYIQFNQAPVSPSSIFINLIGSSGSDNINNSEFIGDGFTKTYTVENVTYNNQQIYVKINDKKVTNWNLVEDTKNLTIQFDTAPNINVRIQIHLYVLPPNYEDFKAYSEVLNQLYQIPNDYVEDPRGYYIELPEPILYSKPWEAKVSIMVNGSELEPGNQSYYNGDGKTLTYSLPTTRNVDDVSLIADSQILVIVNGIEKVNQVDYIINNNGVDIPTVTFATAPFVGDQIVISNRYNSDFVIYDNNFLIIKNSYELFPGDVINVTVYSNHDNYDIRTQVFSGAITSNATIYSGFDTVALDFTGFEDEKDTVVNTTYTFSRPVTNINNLEMYFNGTKLVPYYDFIFLTPTTFKLSNFFNVAAKDIIIVKHINENYARNDIEYRIFKGITETYEYFKISTNTTTTLSRDLKVSDQWIYVTDISTLTQPDPVHANPGVLFINGERITFYVIDFINKRLGQLRRATNGTGGADIHKAGSLIYDAGQLNEIPESRDSYVPVDIETTLISKNGKTKTIPSGALIRQGHVWYENGSSTPSNGLGIQQSNTIQANFLREL